MKNRTDDSELLFAAWAEATVAEERPPERLRHRLFESLSRNDAAAPAAFSSAFCPAFLPFVATLRRLLDLGDAALGEVLRKIDGAGSWTAGPPGVDYFHFAIGPEAAAAEAGIVRLQPGATFPRHRHLGPEVTFVLTGLLIDADGAHGPGSLLEAAAGSTHDYRAGQAEENSETGDSSGSSGSSGSSETGERGEHSGSGELILVSKHGGIAFV